MNKLQSIVEVIVLVVGVAVSGIFTLCGGVGLLNMFLETETIIQQIYVQVCMCSALLCLLIAAVGFSTCTILIKMGSGNAMIKNIITKSPFRSGPVEATAIEPPAPPA